MTAIVTDALTKHYGDVRAVTGLDLEVREGEVFGFLGPNGAGKTTTIRLLLDLIRPTSGRARVLGEDPWKARPALRRRIGYLPSESALYGDFTGKQMLHYLARLRGVVDWSLVESLAERLGADLSRRLRSLSTGNRRKVGIVQAFMHEPELLILDEPTGGLDPLVQTEFQRMVVEVRERGGTVFLSSHTLDEVDRVADRVGIMRAGRLVVVDDLAALKHRATRRLEVEFARPVDDPAFAAVDNVREVAVDGNVVRFTVEGALDPLVKTIASHQVLDIRVPEVDLEEVFLGYYGDGDGQRR